MSNTSKTKLFLVTRLWQTVPSHTTLIISYKPEYQSLHTGARVTSSTILRTQNIWRDLSTLPYQVLNGLMGFLWLFYLGWVTRWFYIWEKKNIEIINPFLCLRTSKYLKRMKFVLAIIVTTFQPLRIYRLSNWMSTAIEVSLPIILSWIRILVRPVK